MKLGAKDLRTTKGDPEIIKNLKKNPIYIILDNVLDTYNVGAIFRLADAASAQKVILCGATETPPHTRIKKASINTTEWVSWSYAPTAVEALQELKSLHSASSGQEISNLKIVAIEQSSKSVPYDKYDYQFPLALVVGHESDGISKEVLEMADVIVEIPMFGVNKSLNVMVSLGIVLYEAIGKMQ